LRSLNIFVQQRRSFLDYWVEPSRSGTGPAVWVMSDRPPPRLRQPDRQQVIPAMALEDLLDTDH
jgi:hypothetical protein